ncbi:MAG TPA: SDR family oxidoreductase [Spirochaetota bacterium]|nr:SDR family oxidoreductase [Spirochaetota bacterium]HOD14938.1 SDR family oxidoreductase [Spirochaetota bacterium]HPG52054.1 SDR family oxidoreductase [Spirochaetota bacterium]HPN12295.1 SDR family oxidoreductase [Spirochaetota bacterium]HQL82686.1 SDR family oxidoreductase [Spirochaetota bacterium]
MAVKSIVVTGGNAGIGKAIALDLAKRKHHVIIVSRNPEKGRAALEEIRGASGNPAVDLVTGDLGAIRSVKEVAETIRKKFPGVSVLINNAGIWPTRLEINPDGLEMAFMVNHMAPLILSTLLLGQLKKNAPARIVNVNAGLYVKGKVDIEKTPYGEDFGKLATYMNTKLCNIYFTQKFSEIINGSGVTVNALHPGVIQTALGDSPGLLGAFMRLVKRSFDTPESGAKPPVWLATSPEVEGINGRYFELCEQKPYAPNAMDPALRDNLWELSMKLASL